jgi:Flp pilus assembly protein CpaB
LQPLTRWHDEPMTSSLHSSKKVRLTSKRRRNPALSIGIALSVAAVLAAAFFAVLSATTHTYLVARVDLPAGATLTQDLLDETSVNLGQASSAYVSSSELAVGKILTRAVKANEFISKSVLSDTPDVEFVNLMVQPAVALSSEIGSGTTVDIYAAAKTLDAKYEAPQILVEGAEVFRITKNAEVFKNQIPLVEVRVSVLQVPAVLAAQAAQSQLAVIQSASVVG